MLSEHELELLSFTMSPAACMSALARSKSASHPTTTHVYTGIPFQQTNAEVDGQMSQNEIPCFGVVFLFIQSITQCCGTLQEVKNNPNNDRLLTL